MTSISALENIHNKGLFGDHEGKQLVNNILDETKHLRPVQ